MKIPAFLFLCLAITQLSQRDPQEQEVQWSDWTYVETRNEVELHWRRCLHPTEPRIQFGLRNRNHHEVTVNFIEHSFIHRDGSFQESPPTSLTIPANQNRGKQPLEFKRMPRSWNLNWEVRKAR